jgi:hypothetical protein
MIICFFEVADAQRRNNYLYKHCSVVSKIRRKTGKLTNSIKSA